jgi:hypothetical protein
MLLVSFMAEIHWDKLTPAKGCRTGPPGYILADRPVRQPYAGVNYIPFQGAVKNSEKLTIACLTELGSRKCC